MSEITLQTQETLLYCSQVSFFIFRYFKFKAVHQVLVEFVSLTVLFVTEKDYY